MLLLATLNLVVDLRLSQIDPNLGEALVDMCLNEMLGGGGDVIPEWHMAASANLVSLAQRYLKTGGIYRCILVNGLF